jgi:uncharacterized protein YkwD
VYYQKRDTATGVLAALIILFIMGTVVAFIFGGFEALEPVKNTITGSSKVPVIIQQPQLPPINVPQPSPPPEKSSPEPTVSEKSPVPGETIPIPPVAGKSPAPEKIIIVPPSLGKSSIPDKTTPAQSATTGKPPPIAGTEMEKQVHALVNMERTKNGLTALTLDAY